MTTKKAPAHDLEEEQNPTVNMHIPTSVKFRVSLQLFMAFFAFISGCGAAYYVYWADGHNDGRYVKNTEFVEYTESVKATLKAQRDSDEKFASAQFVAQEKRLDSMDKKLDMLISRSNP